MRKLNTTYHILEILLDYKRHTIRSISDKVGVSERTIRNHIYEMSILFPIETYVGGRNTGGVQLNSSYFINGQTFTVREIHLIKKSLTFLQQSDPSEELQNLITKLT